MPTPAENEAYWRRKLSGQGSISKPKRSLGDLIENTIAKGLHKAGMDERHAHRTAHRASDFLNDATPVGNVTGAEEGAKQTARGLTRGDLKQAGLGALVMGLSVAPGMGGAKRKLGSLLADEAGAIRAWHVSPHDFDRFSMDKLGTGEGAQAYGKGLYFAEKPDGPTVEHYRQIFGPQSKTYEAEINVEPHELMDWDAPGHEQPEHIRSLMEQAGMRTEAPQPKIRETKGGRFTALNVWGESIGTFADRSKAEAASLERMRDSGSGGLLYSRLGGNTYFPQLDDGSASRKLMDAGVKGARWLNASGDPNMVVFDDSLIDILNKF